MRFHQASFHACADLGIAESGSQDLSDLVDPVAPGKRYTAAHQFAVTAPDCPVTTIHHRRLPGLGHTPNVAIHCVARDNDREQKA